jgi:hypothetical protein
MKTIQFAPDDDIIDICRDNVFKAAFTRDNPLSQGALKRLISAYIGRKVELIAVSSNAPKNACETLSMYLLPCSTARGPMNVS